MTEGGGAYISLRQARDTKCRKARDLNSWLYPHLYYSTACHPALTWEQRHVWKTRTIKWFATRLFLCKKVKDFFSLLQSQLSLCFGPKHTGQHSSLTSGCLFYSQPVRTHSSLPLWWLALAKGEEPLTSAQIWLVAKIRPVRRTQILFTITLTGRELAGLHLCVSESGRRRKKLEERREGGLCLPSSAALQNS